MRNSETVRDAMCYLGGAIDTLPDTKYNLKPGAKAHLLALIRKIEEKGLMDEPLELLPRAPQKRRLPNPLVKI